MKEAEIFCLSEIAYSFATRSKGREVSELVAEKIARKSPGTLIVDWEGVLAASPSFIDEFVGGISDAVDRHYCAIAFTGENVELMGLVDVILKRRKVAVEFAPRYDGRAWVSSGFIGHPSTEEVVVA